MHLDNVPYIASLTTAGKLRVATLKLINYATLNFQIGGDFAKTQLVPFWQDQLTRIDKKCGDPSDGLFLGLGTVEIRKELYQAMSEMRLSGNPNTKAELKAFIEYCIQHARSLDTALSKYVLTPAALTATVLGKNANMGSLTPTKMAGTSILSLEVNRTSKFIRVTFEGGTLPLGTAGLHFKWGKWEFDLPKGTGNFYQTNVSNFGADVVEMYAEMLPNVGKPLAIELTAI